MFPVLFAFLCLLPLWRVNPFSLDQDVDGLTRLSSDPILAFVHETALDSVRCWVNWDQVLETRLSLFTLWCNVWLLKKTGAALRRR